MEQEPLVGIISPKNDLNSLIRGIVENEGFRTAIKSLQIRKMPPPTYLDFLSTFDPKVLVIDIPVPIQENWNSARSLMALEESKNRAFVLTTCNKEYWESQSDKPLGFELVSMPFNLDEFAQTVVRSYQSLGDQKSTP